MKDFFKRKRLAFILSAVGALGGLLYWRFIGCTSGTCPIQSVWYWSTLWGAGMGYLVGDIVIDMLDKRKKGKEKSE